MHTYAGTLRFEKTVGRSDIDGNFFQKLSKCFPSAFSNSHIFSYPAFSLYGNFESTSNEVQELFFAGEIFNRNEIASLINSSVSKFKDNAVLVHGLILEKGIDEVKKINGQFIIIYFDKQQKKVSILNDHLGIQELYYYLDKNVFLFGSELKFLLAHPECPKEIDWETSLKQPMGFTVLSSFESYKTWFKEISILPGGTIFELDLSTGIAKEKKYWSGLSNSNHNYEKDTRTAEQVMVEYISLLEDAVRIRIADEASGYSLLSGGLDSTVICALAAKHKPLETFSIITQMTCLEDTTTVCDRLSKDLGFKNTQFLVPFHELTFNAQLWKQRIWRAESPANHTDSFTKTFLHYGIRKNYSQVKHLLSGTGSDEFNGGYVRWVINDAETEEESWENFFNEIVSTENRKLINRADEGFWSMRKFINRDFLSSVSSHNTENNPWMFYVKSALHSAKHTLLGDEMRASSSHGHSTRFPFLDFRFVEFISRIPHHLHKELFNDKQILRVPAGKILPGYAVKKQKVQSCHPGYDFGFRLFNFLTDKNDLQIEALGDLDKHHPVINKNALQNRINHLRKKPEMMEWVYIMHIINLGLLEKLPGKNESDLDYESSLEAPMEIAFNNAAETKIFLEKRLAIKGTEELLNCSLQFENDCSLVFDKLNNKYFLAKDNTLAYEIEGEYVDWKNFLTQIDNIKSANQILNDLNIKFETIEDFFRLSLREQILITKENHH